MGVLCFRGQGLHRFPGKIVHSLCAGNNVVSTYFTFTMIKCYDFTESLVIWELSFWMTWVSVLADVNNIIKWGFEVNFLSNVNVW